MTGDLVVALHNMDLEKELDFMRQQLQESARQMRTLLANPPGMAYRC